MKSMIHPIAAVLALICIFSFFSATVVVELLGSVKAIAQVKGLIVFPGLAILVPAIILTGASGFALAKDNKGELVRRKMKKMPYIAANGLFILIPSAIYLNRLAVSGNFDSRFYTVQAIELLAGLLNLILMTANLRDGLRLTGRRGLVQRRS